VREPDDVDATALGPLEVRRVQPYEARKAYTCPSCHGTVAAGTGHYVVVPTEAPDLRRHWHRGCWDTLPVHRRRQLPY
jgi:hypothetical protein